jgi:hypothetical protein
MISQKDLEFRNNLLENPTIWIFTFGPLNFWKKLQPIIFQKKSQTSIQPTRRPLDFYKKAFNFPQNNKTPKHNQTTSNFASTTPYSTL